MASRRKATQLPFPGRGGSREEEGSDDGPILFRRRARVPVGAAVPPLPPHLVPTDDAIAAEFIAETNGRERFETATTDDFLLAAKIFARYRLPSLAVIRQTGMGCAPHVCLGSSRH